MKAEAGSDEVRVSMRDNKGFSLIELLIVVAIILIIAAVAIPNLLRARIAANEASAAQSLRQINTAEFAYNAAYPNLGYSTDLASLGGPPPCSPSSTTACLLDNTLASAINGSGGHSRDAVSGQRITVWGLTALLRD